MNMKIGSISVNSFGKSAELGDRMKVNTHGDG